ncbi:MAG: hypothetical protein QOG17_863, partial [Gammaproteobacteria bacterium]|nr:hypothetical protein [Gammaproteobacteria bacterium]
MIPEFKPEEILAWVEASFGYAFLQP